MSLTKLFLTIEKSAIGRFFERKRNLIEQLNPDRIYIENVRAIFNVPHFAAKIFCEMAVIEGVYNRFYGVECNNSDCVRILKSVEKKSDLPTKLKCQNCEILEKDNFEFTTTDLHIVVYYKLNRK